MLTEWLNNHIVTKAMNNPQILIIGHGYVGQRCADVWGEKAVMADKRVESVADVVELIERFKPTLGVLNAAGVRGKPNVDWCETHQLETAVGNVKLPIMIAEGCAQTGTYLLHIGSGCVFYGDSPEQDGWKEDDFANPISYYSKCKYAADLALWNMPNVGVARIRVPLDNRPYPGNIIDKLANYPKIIDVANSITVIPDMIDVFEQLIAKKAEGIFHVTNPGAIKYRTLMELYRQYVDPNQTNEWITEEQLVSEGLVSKTRSTNVLQTHNLAKYDIEMPAIEEAVEKALKEYAEVKKAQ